MANLNKVFLVGNLTRDPELRNTASGASVSNFDIAVNRKYKQGDDWKTEVMFFKIVVWGKSADNCAKYLAKGRPVLVECRLQNRNYDDNEGNKRYVTEIVADNVQFLGSAGNAGKADGGKMDNEMTDTFGAAGFSEDDQDQVPF